MAKKPASTAQAAAAAEILSYRHPDRRKNNPEVGMVTPATDPDEGKTAWQHDPHLDPSLSWTGKAERTSFEVDTVSLHVHERIDPASILSAARKSAGESTKDKAKGSKAAQQRAMQPGLFDAPFESLPLRDAIDFYKHDKGWSNRLVAGDSLLVMNSLLQKEGMAGQVQTIYFDPPYGIKYGSNFQPFVNKRDVKDRKDEDLTQEPEMIKAFRDTWELGIHSYLTYLRDRLLLAKELLNETGSVFVQISDENVHFIRNVLDEVFGLANFCSEIVFRKTTGKGSQLLDTTNDYIIWYAKDRNRVKYRATFELRSIADEENLRLVQLDDGRRRRLTTGEIESQAQLPPLGRVFRPNPLTNQRPAQGNDLREFEFNGKRYSPGQGTFRSDAAGLQRLSRSYRLIGIGSSLNFVRFLDDFQFKPRNNIWDDTRSGGYGEEKSYVVQTGSKVIERCLLMTTDPGDLVFDPTCGSGTTAYVAEKWGRRWMTCDTSRVAVTLAKQRLMTASFDYYELRYPHEGLRGGFIWKTVPHVTLKSIANNPEIDAIFERMHPAVDEALAELNRVLKADAKEWEVPFDFPEGATENARPAFEAFHAARRAMQKAMDRSIADHADQETLYDQPAKSKNKLRITGPFSVEAVPFPTVQALDEAQPPTEADASIARSGESSRQHQWRDELLKTGIRGKGGQILKFAELESLPGTKYLHCTGHTEDGQRVVVHFGPEHAALEQRAVANALTEAGELFPLPKMIVFCAFAFDPEAAKDIDHLKGIVALKAQMNTDLLTEDLKKARASNQSFWLMGQPDVAVRRRKDGLYEVEVKGFDYFDTAKGELVSGGKGRIALWSLDTDYDERSLFPHQVFFPLAGKGEGWEKLKKDIRAELDEDALEAFHGTVSLPFAAGDNRKIAVKIVDDRGIESLKVVNLE
jgi:adenine-specific DNA-methyltransferase